MTQTAISLNQVVVAYQSQPVLWNVSADIYKGKLTALIGPNGAGKSTLIKAMLDLHPPVAGSVSFSAAGKTDAAYSEVKKAIAYVPQKSSVDWSFPTTVLDVVVMGRYGHLGWFKRPKKHDIQLAEEMLEKVGMETFKDRQISQLSGGQRQRVFMARALAQQADIYILDEPLAGVDIKTERIIMQLLRELVLQGKTVMVVHHDLQTVEEYFDEVVFLNRQIIAAGPTESTFTQENIEETYRKEQTVQSGVSEG